MNMPVQVARAAEIAEQRQKELLDAQDTPEVKSPEENAAPAQNPAPAPAPQETGEAEQLRRQLELADQRYRTLQGMYDADRDRSQAQFNQLQAQLAELKQAPAPAQGPVSEQDAEKFDQETIDFVIRVATSVATSVANDIVNAALVQRLDPVQQTMTQVASHVQQTAQERYYSDLDGVHADWRAINVSPQFIQWLQNVDPMSGYQINAMLQDAHQKMDVARVAAIFGAYKNATGAQPAAAPAPQRRVVDERANLVEPPRGGSTSPGQRGGAGGQTYSRADIAQFYRDVTAGRIDRARAAVMEQDILKAQSEGRIVG